MARARILVVDDDPKTVAAVRLYLEHGGYSVDVAGDGRSAIARAREAPPDLVVLDRMLPVLDGLAVFRALRAFSRVPVILLTARTTEQDRLQGLDLGADDYVSKPFSPRELVARVRAVLRRARPEEAGALIELGDLVIDPARREVTRAGVPVRLTPREFSLLVALARTPGRVFTRPELRERALGPDSEALDRTVDAHVMNLRRKLEPDPAAPVYLETVFGVGYRLLARRPPA